METLLYNINSKIYKNSDFCKSRTHVIKLHGVERALCRCENQHMKIRMFAAISQQQQVLRVGCY